MKVLIIDDFAIVTRGLMSLILEYWPGSSFTCADSGSGIINEYRANFDLIIYDPVKEIKDYQMLISRMLVRNPKSNILIYSDLSDLIFAIPMLKLGVKGYISKTTGEEELITALSIVIAGRQYASKNVLDMIMGQIVDKSPSRKQQLSDREMEVAALLARGSKITDIASSMGLNIGTISTYKIRIFKKLNVKSIIELANAMNASFKA